MQRRKDRRRYWYDVPLDPIRSAKPLMRLEDKQDQLNLAALHAVCAKAGCGYVISGRI